LGFFDLLRRLVGKKPATPPPASEEAASPLDEVVAGPVLAFVREARNARDSGHYNRRIPLLPDRLVTDALYRVFDIYFPIEAELGKAEASKLFEGFCASMLPDMRRYRDAPDFAVAKTVIRLMMERAGRFGEELTPRFGSDKGMRLVAANFSRALKKLEEEERRAAG
jgi:hypothetical protein